MQGFEPKMAQKKAKYCTVNEYDIPRATHACLFDFRESHMGQCKCRLMIFQLRTLVHAILRAQRLMSVQTHPCPQFLGFILVADESSSCPVEEVCLTRDLESFSSV